MYLAESWFQRDIVEAGRLPLFCFLCAFIGGFAFIRFSVRMIRAQVRWWPGNVQPGGTHIHHVVFGVVFMLVSGVSLIGVNNPSTGTRAVLAAVFGVGAALVLDEFALILHLRDVYWTEEGRTSVDAVFVALAMVLLVLFGFRPVELLDYSDYQKNPSAGTALLLVVYFVIQVAMVVATLLKGKVWTGLIGLFILPLLVIGMLRLSRPGAPWARWWYRGKPKKLARAARREERWRVPVIAAKTRVQDFLSGKPDPPGWGTERELPETTQRE